MTALEFIKRKQKDWAEGKDFTLLPGTIGSETGNKIYFDDYNKNLYAKLSEDNKNDYNKGSGGEIRDTTTRRAPMKAAFSSSAIVVNLHQYWQKKNNISPLLEALGFKNNKVEKKGIVFKFESKNPIKGIGGYPPHLDVVITTDTNNFAIESKFTEPYTEKRDKNSKERGKNSEIQHSYIADKKKTLWENSPNLENLAQAIHSPNALIENEEIKEEIKELIKKLRKTNHLDASQLIKHILGLKSNYKENFTLLYLWYDVPGTEGYEHRQEIEAFASIAKADGIDFRHITYQKVISYLEENYKNEHKDYIDYLVKRYL
ncbi:MAG: hypothetical protein IJY67_03080 [Paludibacteraceae bacterium]|nr:hypothetical protein [Paludibacteraceae bacterium]